MQQKLFSFLFTCLLLISVSYGQDFQISGRVTSQADGNPIANVTVRVQGKNLSSQTDADGSYTIRAAEGNVIVFRSLGYKERSITVEKMSTINIQLEAEEGSIDEVLVVGYGSGNNIGSVVGSQVTVRAKDIAGKPAPNAIEALQGKVPGLSVMTSSGEPSTTQSIRLHGSGSLGASSTPLFVIDGIPVGSGSILSTNPDDWESITVLKDASATSIYGSRAANGVIYFKSKKGKASERATITASAMKGYNNLATKNVIDQMMNSQELQAYWLETGFRTQAQIDEVNKTFGHNETSWGDYYYKKNTGLDQYNLNISGGSEKMQYYISSAYYDQEGIMYRSNFDRITLRSNLSATLNDWIKAGLNLSGGYDKRMSNPYGGNSLNGALSLMALPWYSPYDENGNEYYEERIPGLDAYSPKYLADKNLNEGVNKQFNPTIFLQVQPYKGLTLKSTAGMDYFDYRISGLRLPSYLGNLNNGAASEEYQTAILKTITNTIDYRTLIHNVHDISMMIGQEATDYDESSFSASGSGLTDDRLTLLGQTIANGRGVGSSKSEYAYNSYFGRLGYSYNAKYLLDLSLRTDASSRFGKNNRKATFWAAGVSWKAKSEKFLQDVSWLTDLTIKASIGTQGNSAIGNYQSLATVGSINYDGAPGWGVSSPGNPNLAWEQQTKTTLGVRASFLNQINLDVEVYKRVTDNMLVSVPFPYTSGFSSITSNVGSLENKGIDVQFSANAFRSEKFYFTPYVNFNYNQQKITELFQDKEYWIVPNTGLSWAVGKPVEFFFPVQAGVNPDNGLMQWYVPGENISDSNFDPNNVTTTFNAVDLQQSTGLRRDAPFTGGFGFTSGYNGFYLDMDFAFVKGKYMINNDMYFFSNPYQFRGYNQIRGVRDYWKEPGDQTRYPKFGQVHQFDTGLLEDASFLRLKGLRFGYNIPKKLLSGQKFFKSASVYYVGRNLWTKTKYLGPDPEVDSNLALGVNPNTKQSSLGIQLQF